MKSPYIRFGDKMPLSDVLPYIPTEKKLFQGKLVSLKSLRLKCFAQKGTVCSSCGLVASFFIMERFKKTNDPKSFHVNLYGVNSDGEEILFTHDHTLARSLGGKDYIDNVTTMCQPCNKAKGIEESLHPINQAKVGCAPNNFHKPVKLSSMTIKTEKADIKSTRLVLSMRDKEIKLKMPLDMNGDDENRLIRCTNLFKQQFGEQFIENTLAGSISPNDCDKMRVRLRKNKDTSNNNFTTYWIDE